MESTDSSGGTQQPQLPPGFRFHPTDEELVVHYLKKKVASTPLPVDIIAEVDLYKFDPWELPAKATFGEQEWYFFSPRERKYPNGARPNRAATSGYWKATGTDKPVCTAGGTQKVGVKKALVFYGGKPPKGEKTNWIMHEYRIAENKTSNKPPGCDVASKKVSLRLDDWVLCRIYKKNNTQRPIDHERDEINDMMIGSISPCMPNSIPPFGTQRHQELLKASNCGALFDNEHLYEGMMNNSTRDMMNNGSNISQLSSKLQLPVNLLPAKRPLPAGLYWSIEDNGSSPSTKRFLGDENVDDGLSMNNNTSLLSQFPQSPSLHQQPPVLGSLTDGVFRQPYNQVTGMNWPYS